MQIKPINSAAEHQAALQQIRIRMNTEMDHNERDAMEVLVTPVEHYESRHYDIAAPDPIEAIRFRLREGGLKQRNLEPFIGSPGRVSEILSYKRKLTVAMIRRLHAGLNIPAACLIQDYALKR